MNLKKLTLTKIRELVVKNRECSLSDILSAYKDQYEANKDINGYIEFFDDAFHVAKKYYKLIEEGKDFPLFGALIAVKDNIAVKGKKLTAASEILQGYVSPYDATVIKRLKNNGAIIIGRTNMDEFAMGSCCEFSSYGATLNPINKDYVIGGSSGGSAAVVAGMQAPFSLGSDTGGSVRLPASFSGTIGFKPSYGGLSRYGLVAYSSSFDQIGFFSKSVEDILLILKYTSGADKMDATSIDIIDEDNIKDLKGSRLAFIKEFNDDFMDEDIAMIFSKFKDNLTSKGAIVSEVSVSEIEYVLSIYYSISPVEAASNLARYSGLRYGKKINENLSMNDFYIRHRSEFLGEEVKRRIILGNYLFYEERNSKYYSKARSILENLIIPKFKNLFKEYDFIISPTSLTKPFKIGSKIDDPVKIYYFDICTVIANLIGSPAISLPFSNLNGLPIGMQIIGKKKLDFELLNFSKNLVKELGL